MTDQPYTPTTEQIELLVLGQLKQSAEKRGLPVDVEADRADFRNWLAERDARIEAAAEQRGAEAALLCVDEPSWEHHDQTDGFPCTNCLNKAQKNIDRYRADRIANKEGDIE